MSQCTSSTWSTSTSSLKKTEIKNKPPNNFIIPSSSKQNHPKTLHQIEAESNEAIQKKIDNEVIISGFTSEPDGSLWKMLVEIGECDEKLVTSHSVFESKDLNSYVTIGFKDKTTQQKFLKKFNSAKNRPMLYAHERLSRFNAAVEKELRNLFNRQIISGYTREGFLFKAITSESNRYTLIDTQATFEKFVKKAKEEDQNEKPKNLRDQKALEHQVVLKTFTIKPLNVEYAVHKFFDLIGVSQTGVVNSRITEAENDRWLIYIKVADKSVMREILKSKKLIEQSTLIRFKAWYVTNPFIKWERALTDFNINIESQLKKARNAKKIEKFEFAENCFKVKVDKASPWRMIECNQDLNAVLGTIKKSTMRKRNSIESITSSFSSISMSSAANSSSRKRGFK